MSTAFEFRNITKTFGAVTANSSVSFAVAQNSIHGVVGENGAGKSTIMKVLYGLYPPDSGEIYVREKKTLIPTPEEAIRLGIGMVHQHFMLVPTLTVWENIILGGEPSLALFNRKNLLNRLENLQRDFGFSLDLNRAIYDLPVGQQQQVEILKLLYHEATILVLDEPTAVLTPQEVVTFFEKLRTLKEKNKTIVLITHKLKEILSFTENVTVMRQGRVIETLKTDLLTERSLAEKIIGRKQVHLPKRTHFESPTPVLEVKHLRVVKNNRALLHDLSFHIMPGEIVGIAGIEGNGQHELVETVANVNRRYSGDILFQGERLAERKTYVVKQQGLAIIPPDRHKEGLLLDFTVQENTILGHHKEKRFTKGVFLSQSRISEFTKAMTETFDVRPRNPLLPISALSGGNQQKVIVGRETSSEVKFLLASHPTRGVDIGAIEFIHGHFLALREKGAGILLLSSELDEILALSDRIIVLYQGNITGETSRLTANETELGLWMTGGHA